MSRYTPIGGAAGAALLLASLYALFGLILMIVRIMLRAEGATRHPQSQNRPPGRP
jgi:hypothetical protein